MFVYCWYPTDLCVTHKVSEVNEECVFRIYANFLAIWEEIIQWTSERKTKKFWEKDRVRLSEKVTS